MTTNIKCCPADSLEFKFKWILHSVQILGNFWRQEFVPDEQVCGNQLYSLCMKSRISPDLQFVYMPDLKVQWQLLVKVYFLHTRFRH